MNEYIRLLSLTSLKTRGRDNIESIPAESRKVKEAKKKGRCRRWRNEKRVKENQVG